ncbi:NAD(P)H-hydrate dehydratase [Patescibacteria group bacterium]|nr:NAD(P)H-hydrate dehydratase [Patescibacteria group bacterium]
MENVTIEDIRKLSLPKPDSHKGQNGRLLIVGGSHLFHAASLWSLTVASRIVDLVHYSSIPENNQIVHELKKEFRNGMVVSRDDVEDYIKEDDIILIGPGMTRDEETKTLTDKLLQKYPEKQWVLDAGALQMVELENIPKNVILTPHHQEFEMLLKKSEIRISKSETNSNFQNFNQQENKMNETVQEFAKKYHCIILLKGKKDIASNGEEIRVIEGGNAGMTKGGTGDVLAGLIAALACKNDPWISTLAGSFINKKAGDELYKTVGPFFNATDLANQIPKTMKTLLPF